MPAKLQTVTLLLASRENSRNALCQCADWGMSKNPPRKLYYTSERKAGGCSTEQLITRPYEATVLLKYHYL